MLQPISAPGDALKLLIGGPAPLYVVAFGTLSVLAQVFFQYERYVSILKWLTLVLFAYVIALFIVKVPWGEALEGLFIPRVQWNGAFQTTLVAILGTDHLALSVHFGSHPRKPKSRTSTQTKSR
jgi:Mn2+/Fe2+ NRAMP family transporter